MLLLTNPQKIYIAISVFVVVTILIIIAVFIFRKIYVKKHYQEATYLRLANLAKMNDFLLLNNLYIDYDDKHLGVINHLLISKKYVYVINDFSLDGVISGDYRDRFLKHIDKDGKVRNISNPLNYNINLVKRLNLTYNLDKTLVKGISVIDDESEINIPNSSDQFFIVKRSELNRLILNFDKEDVKPLKEEQIVSFINKLDKDNRRFKQGE